MLEQEVLDAVYLAVPHHLHYEMLSAAIQARLPTLVEKPLTRTLEEGMRIVQEAQARGVRVGVNYQYRYDCGCYALARAVQKGALGTIHYARCNLPWSRDEGYFQQAGWHANISQAGGGTLITQGSHMIDILLWALGDSPRTVTGFTAQRRFRDVEVEDVAQSTIETESGALLQVCSSMVASTEQALSIEVYGARGTALYSDRPLPHTKFRGVRVKRARPPHWGVHALQRGLEGFRAWVADGQPYLVPAIEALPTLAVVEAIYRSAQSGQKQTVASFLVDAAHD
jgi:predicted dehydrogenase